MKITVIITLISGVIVLLLLNTALVLPIDEEKALEGKLTVHLGYFACIGQPESMLQYVFQRQR
jgi:hypothetical protein